MKKLLAKVKAYLLGNKMVALAFLAGVVVGHVTKLL